MSCLSYINFVEFLNYKIKDQKGVPLIWIAPKWCRVFIIPNFAIRYGRLPNYNKGFAYTKAL